MRIDTANDLSCLSGCIWLCKTSELPLLCNECSQRNHRRESWPQFISLSFSTSFSYRYQADQTCKSLSQENFRHSELQQVSSCKSLPVNMRKRSDVAQMLEVRIWYTSCRNSDNYCDFGHYLTQRQLSNCTHSKYFSPPCYAFSGSRIRTSKSRK